MWRLMGLHLAHNNSPILRFGKPLLPSLPLSEVKLRLIGHQAMDTARSLFLWIYGTPVLFSALPGFFETFVDAIG